MKNKILIILFTLLFSKIALAENVNIQAKKISIDKKEEITIFENEVRIVDDQNNIIKSDYAKYNKKLNFFTLKNNIILEDSKGNIFKSDNASYDKNNGLFKTLGKSSIVSSEGYIVETENVSLDLINNIASSKNLTKIIDLEKNTIDLDNFEYLSKENIFKSIGKINVKDKIGNKYEFSQIYLDEKQREIIGTDAKAFLNQKEFKLDERNKPRVFSNAVSIKGGQTKFIKSAFTLCDYREKDKCPPWELRAKEMKHDSKKKTVYYDNAVIKIYNLPIFYLPKMAHPDQLLVVDQVF